MSPSQHMASIIAGHTDIKDAPKAVQSWARFHLFEMAVDVIKLSSQESRKAALDCFPDRLRPYVGDEIKRLWPVRRTL